jgi:hypothetical protein
MPLYHNLQEKTQGKTVERVNKFNLESQKHTHTHKRQIQVVLSIWKFNIKGLSSGETTGHKRFVKY